MVELREVGNEVQLWVTHPVDVTVVHEGRRRGEAKWLWKRVKRFSQPLFTPNGKPRFLSAIFGLPVVRYQPHYDANSGRGALFVTPGGTVLRLTARQEPFSDELDYRADALGLYFHIRMERADAVDVSRELSHRLGFPVSVTVSPAGEVAVSGGGRLTDKQKQYVRDFLRSWRAK